MKLPNLNRKEQILICAFILLAFGTLLYRLVVFPELRRVDAHRLQLDMQKDLMNMNVQEIQRRNKLDNNIMQLEEAIAAIRDRSFDRDKIANFLKTLPQLVRDTGNVLVSIAPQDMKKPSSPGKSPYITMPVSVAINGHYSEIIRFLRLLHEYKQLISVGGLKIVTASRPSEVNAQITLDLYVYED